MLVNMASHLHIRSDNHPLVRVSGGGTITWKSKYTNLLSTWQSSRAAMTTSRVLYNNGDNSRHIHELLLGNYHVQHPSLRNTSSVWTLRRYTLSVSLTCHKIELWLISGFNYHHSSTMLVPCSKGVDQPAITHTVLVVTRVYNSLLSHSISLAGKVLLREFPNINGLVSLLKEKNFSQF